MRERLDLFHRGDRDYLQGSLILSQAVAAFARTHGPDEPRPVAVTRASFRAIARRHCVVVDAAPPDGASLASALLRLDGGGVRSLFVVEDEGRPEPPPRMPDPPGLVLGWEGGEALSAKASLSPLDSLDALVSALVQVDRRAFADARPWARNVFLLSIFDTALPLELEAFARGARVVVSLEHHRRTGERNVIVQHVVLEGEGAPPLALRMMCSWEESPDREPVLPRRAGGA